MEKNSTNQTLRFFWQHISAYPKYLTVVLINVPLTVFVYNFIPALVVANVLNRLSQHDYQPHHLWASFGTSILEYAFLLLLGGVVMWRITDLFLWKLEAGVERDIVRRVFNHLLAQSSNFHANTFSGALVSKTNKIMGSYIRFADTTFFQVIPLFASLIFTLIILSTKAPLFVAILLIFSVSYIVIALYISREVRRLSAIESNAESTQTGYLADALVNVMAIKSFAGSEFERQQFGKLTDITHSRITDVMHGSRNQLIYLTSITNTISALALAMAVVGVMVFKSNLATVFLILTYTSSIATQLFGFGTSVLRNYNRAFGDATDMVKILGIEPEVKDPLEPEKLKIKKGAIEFKEVDFTHSGAGDVLFHKLNVDIKAGEKVGLVGHSGSGKTTFMRLILRFSDIDGGEILIDGQNIANITQDDLRRSIAYVPQEPIMFHRTLRENIYYGRQDASKAEVTKVAKLAHADDFIKQLPEGYETLVGERGVKLSGGQRQRIAIARAMLKNAPILVLDEATSALDSDSEVLIQDALRKLMEGRTTIVIAHRLSTIQKMDRILVLEEGEITEEGTHKDLLAANGIYAKLWAHQSGGFIDE